MNITRTKQIELHIKTLIREFKINKVHLNFHIKGIARAIITKGGVK